MKVTSDFVFFWGGPFSQWHPCKFMVQNYRFNCAEQYMMFRKALLFKDYDIAREIMLSDNPKYQKELGKKIQNFNETIWIENREKIVKEGNLAKFGQNEDLRKELFQTHNKLLVEASPYNQIWGIGLSESDPKCLNKTEWNGLNLLGQCLTNVRNDLRYTFNDWRLSYEG